MALDREFTLIYDRKVQGFPAFSDRVPGFGISLNNRLFTTRDGNIWEEYVETQDRNRFYGDHFDSEVTVLLNDAPETIKNFKTLGYEGDGNWRADITSDQETETLYLAYEVFEVSTDGQTEFTLPIPASRGGITRTSIVSMTGEVIDLNGTFTVDRRDVTYTPNDAATDALVIGLEVRIEYTTTNVIAGGLSIPPMRTVSGSVLPRDFVTREGKHFSFIRGRERTDIDLDLNSFTTTGYGIGSVISTSSFDRTILGTPRAIIGDVDTAINDSLSIGIDGPAGFVRIPQVATREETLVTTRSVTLNGTTITDYALSLTERGFFLGTSRENLNVADNRLVATGTDVGVFSLNVSALDGGTEYFYQAFAENDSGVGLGTIDSFTTPARVLPIVSTRVVFNADQTSANIIADVNDTDQAPGVPFVYQWTRNAVVIPNETNDRITVSEDGLYLVTVTDQDREMGSAFEQIDVNVPVTGSFVIDELVTSGQPATVVLTATFEGLTLANASLAAADGVNVIPTTNAAELISTGTTTFTIIPPNGITEYTYSLTDLRGGTFTSTDSVTAGNVPVITFATVFSGSGEHTATITPTVVDTDQPAGVDFTNIGWFQSDGSGGFTEVTSRSINDSVFLLGTGVNTRLATDIDGTFEFRVTDATSLQGRECIVVDVNDNAPMATLTAPPTFNAGTNVEVMIIASDDTDTLRNASLTVNGGANILSSSEQQSIEAGTLTTVRFTPVGGDQDLVFTIEDSRGAIATDTHTVLINMTTNTLNFRRSDTNFTLSPASSVLSGRPGQAITPINVSTTAISGRRKTGTTTCSFSPDPGGLRCTNTSAGVQVVGTFPATSNTVSVTVSQPTQVDPPNISVSSSGSGQSFRATADDGGRPSATGSFTSNCAGARSPDTQTRTLPATFSFNPGDALCSGPQTCGGRLTVSASGYDAGSATFSRSAVGICTQRCVSISYSGGGTIAGNSTWGCSGFRGVDNGGTAQTTCSCAQSGQDITAQGGTTGRLRIRPAPNSNRPTCSGGGGITVRNVFGVTAGNGDPEWLIDWSVNTPGGSGSISCSAN